MEWLERSGHAGELVGFLLFLIALLIALHMIGGRWCGFGLADSAAHMISWLMDHGRCTLRANREAYKVS